MLEFVDCYNWVELMFLKFEMKNIFSFNS